MSICGFESCIAPNQSTHFAGISPGMSAKQFREGKVISMSENETVENEVSETEKECDCEVCKAWRDEESMYEGTFKMPIVAFDAIQRTIPIIRADNKHLRNASDSVVLGFALGAGAKNEIGNHIRKNIEETIGKALSEALSK